MKFKLKHKEIQIARISIILGVFALWVTYFSMVSAWHALLISSAAFIISFFLFYINEEKKRNLLPIIPVFLFLVNATLYGEGAEPGRALTAHQYSMALAALEERDTTIKEMASIIKTQENIINAEPTYDDEEVN